MHQCPFLRVPSVEELQALATTGEIGENITSLLGDIKLRAIVEKTEESTLLDEDWDKNYLADAAAAVLEKYGRDENQTSNSGFIVRMDNTCSCSPTTFHLTRSGSGYTTTTPEKLQRATTPVRAIDVPTFILHLV